MKCEIIVSFSSSKRAREAQKLLSNSVKGSREAKVAFSSAGETLKAEVSAPSFSVLRALSTTIFRDLKIILDASELSEENEGD